MSKEKIYVLECQIDREDIKAFQKGYRLAKKMGLDTAPYKPLLRVQVGEWNMLESRLSLELMLREYEKQTHLYSNKNFRLVQALGKPNENGVLGEYRVTDIIKEYKGTYVTKLN